jgi:hypothetical protein
MDRLEQAGMGRMNDGARHLHGRDNGNAAASALAHYLVYDSTRIKNNVCFAGRMAIPALRLRDSAKNEHHRGNRICPSHEALARPSVSAS